MSQIINHSPSYNSQAYTDKELELVIKSLEKALGFHIHNPHIKDEPGTSETEIISITEQLGSKADKGDVDASETPRLVTYNEQGIITGGQDLSAKGPIELKDGEISHQKPVTLDVVPSEWHGINGTIPFLRVDEFGHIIEIGHRTGYTINYNPAGQGQEGKSLRIRDGDFVPEEVDREVRAGSDNLVTSDAVFQAIKGSTTAVFRVKGSCTYAELMEKSDMQVGDVWNISEGQFVGANYVWVATEEGGSWDKLSETSDLTEFITKDDIEDHLHLMGNVAHWGHVKTSDATPLSDTLTGSAGTDNGLVARADHTHPIVTGPVEAGSILPVSGDAITSKLDSVVEEINERIDTVVADAVGEVKHEWGSIEGDITAQEDLQTELAKKQDMVKVGFVYLSSADWAKEGVGFTQNAPVFRKTETDEESFALPEKSVVFVDWDSDANADSLGLKATAVTGGSVDFLCTDDATPAKDLRLDIYLLEYQ